MTGIVGGAVGAGAKAAVPASARVAAGVSDAALPAAGRVAGAAAPAATKTGSKIFNATTGTAVGAGLFGVGLGLFGGSIFGGDGVAGMIGGMMFPFLPDEMQGPAAGLSCCCCSCCCCISIMLCIAMYFMNK